MNAERQRYLSSVALSMLVTISLFLLKNYLITHGMEAITDEVAGDAIDFTRVDRDESINTKDRDLPDRPDKPDVPPPPPPMNLNTNTAPDSGGVSINAPALYNLNLDRSGLNAPTDGDAIPLVRVPPQYPQRANSRGIEGWVQLEFTITESGAVTDIVVVAAEPSGYFERAAERALSRWKYKPKIIDGRPARRYNNQVVITFELEK